MNRPLLSFGQPLGGICQVAFVVSDIRAAIREHVERLRIGPWLTLDGVRPLWQKYRGRPTSPDVSIALSFSGSIMLELIQQHDDSPSVFQDVIAQSGYGMHHVAVSTQDFAGECARYRKMGFEPAYEAELEGGARAAYFDTRTVFPYMIEVVDMSPLVQGIWASIKTTCTDWDGSDPIRTPEALFGART